MQMQCDQFRQFADSYLNSELIVETNHQIISHLEHCAECRRELVARRELRAKLRHAFTSAPENQMRAEFGDHLIKQLRDHALGRRIDSVRAPNGSLWFGRPRRTSLLALAACLVLVTGIGLVLLQRLSQPPHSSSQGITPKETAESSPQFSPGVQVNLDQTELAKSAVADHRDCAIHFRLAEKPIDLDLAGRKFDRVYINLTKAVLSQGNTPLDVEMVEAHSCVFEAHRFAHIVLKYHGRLVSFLVTDSGRAAEPTDTMPATLTQPHVVAYSQFDGYQVSFFQTQHHAVFVVSDMPEGENLALARMLAPPVYAHIMRIENLA